MEVFDICMWDIDVNVFAIRLMRQVVERRSLQWTPDSRLHFTPLPYRRADGYIEQHILPIAMALEKLSFIEYRWDQEEFEHLYIILGTSEEDFIDFFVNSVSTCKLKDYKHFDLIRWLRYIIDFSAFCYINGYPDAINYAVMSIVRKIFLLQYVFTDFRSWKKLINETRRILHVRFLHPYVFNRYLHLKNGSIRDRFRPNWRRK